MDKLVSPDSIVSILNTNPKYDYSHALPYGLQNLLINRMLTGQLRDVVINLIKAPLRKALIEAMKLFVKTFGLVTKEKTILRNTHILIDIRDQFNQHYYNPSRIEMMQAGWELLLSEYEHDSHYRWLFNWLIRKIQESDWVSSEDEFPDEGCWND